MNETVVFLDDQDNEVPKDRATKATILIIHDDGTREEIFGVIDK